MIKLNSLKMAALKNGVRPHLLCQGGFTLIEISITLALLTVLMVMLSFGASYFLKEGKRKESVTEIRFIQQKVRSYAALNSLNIGDAIAKSDLVGTGKLFETEPIDPATNASYTWGSTVPDVGTPYVSSTDTSVDPTPVD